MNYKIVSSAVKGISLALLLGGLAGCSITDPSTDINVNVSMPPTGAVIGGQIKDSFGRIITTRVTINVGGPDSSSVVDLLNNRLTRLTTESGFVVMAINDTLPTSDASPKKLIIYAEARGYLPSAAYVEVGGTQKFFEIRMVSTDVNNLPPGVQGVEVPGHTDDTGSLTSPLSITPPPAVGSGAGTTLNIGTGARFVRANGQPLQGNIEVKFIHGNLASDTSGHASSLIPGGAVDMKTESGEPVLPITNSTLFAVDGSGNLGTIEGGTMDFSTQIPGGTLNPRTGRSYAAGDTVKTYNTNEAGVAVDGQEGYLTGPDGNGNFTVNFSSLTPVISRDSRVNVVSGTDGAFETFTFYNFVIVALGYQDMIKTVLYVWPAMKDRAVYIAFEPAGWHDFFWKGFWGRTDTYDVGLPNDGADTVLTLIYLISNPQLDEVVSVPVRLGVYDWRRDLYAATEEKTVTGKFNGDRNILTINDAWPFAPKKMVTVNIFGKMPEGRDPSEIRPSGLYVQIADAADTSRWNPIGAVQEGKIEVQGLEVGHSYWLKGTYTFRGQTRTANTPWTRTITAETDTLQYWYQLNNDEADDYTRGG